MPHNSNFNVATNHPCSNQPPSSPPDNMSSLLHIVSRVEATVASYVSVQEFTDTDEWRRRLDQEKVTPLFSQVEVTSPSFVLGDHDS